VLVAFVPGSALIAIGVGLGIGLVYRLRTTPDQRAAARARTARIESSALWRRGPLLMGLSIAVIAIGYFLPMWTLNDVLIPIAVVLLVLGSASMILAIRRDRA
jgi:hypothetical protein